MEARARRRGFDEIHAAFQRFPAPLALVDARQGVLQANEAWSARFGAASLLAGGLENFPPAGDERREVGLRIPGSAEVTHLGVRVVGVKGLVMLVVDHDDESGGRAMLESLRGRIAELERLGSTDHLTGAWNRAHFDRTIDAELVRSRAGRHPVSLVLLDIDHFKRINDTFGHATGDAVLRDLVRVMGARIRASDMLFRWGGEEFAVLASAAGYRGAERIAANLREAVARHDFPGAGRVTVSAGVAEHDGEESALAWFGRLDAALYAAKASGRDRVVVDRRGSSDAWAWEAGKSALHLAWQEAYECGDETIDTEHRELFALANRLIDVTVEGGKAGTGVLGALDTLLAHVGRHFADEEAILERLRYADLEPHRRAHKGLLRRAAWLREQAQSGEAGLGTLVEFLAQDVVARHMLTLDRAFFPLFAKRPPDAAGDGKTGR